LICDNFAVAFTLRDPDAQDRATSRRLAERRTRDADADRHLRWYKEAPSLDVVAVHLPVPSVPNMGSFVSKEMIQKYYDDECAAMLAPKPKPARGS